MRIFISFQLLVILSVSSFSQPVTQPYLHIPVIDLNDETFRQVTVDREEGQYLGHPTTVLLEDGKTMLIVYPKGHGKGEIVYKRSTDGGLTWSERIKIPESWKTSKEVPTLYRVADANGKKRVIMFSGLYPARMAISEDDGIHGVNLKKLAAGVELWLCRQFSRLKQERAIIWLFSMTICDTLLPTDK